MRSHLLPVPLCHLSGLALAATVALITACGSATTSSESDVVATAGEAVLTRGDLTSLLTRSPIPPTEALAFGLTSAWIDHALVVQHLEALGSDAIFRAATTETRLDTLTQRLISARVAAARAATTAEVDSVARRGDVHVYRMYAIAISPGDTAAQADGAALFGSIRSAALSASTAPDVPLAKVEPAERAKVAVTDLPATDQAGLPPELAARIWGLSEGEVSMPLRNMNLLQMYYRIPRPEATKALAAWTRLALQQKADVVMLDSVLTARKFAVPDDIAERMRGAFNEPGSITGSAPIATWEGGETTPEEAMAWIRTIPAPIRAQRMQASDADLTDLAKSAGRREIIASLVRQVDSTGMGAAIRSVYDTEVAALTADAAQVATGETASERAFNWSTAETLAKVPYRGEPSGLGAALRSLTKVDVDAVRVRAALGEAVRVWQAPGATSGTSGTPTTP